MEWTSLAGLGAVGGGAGLGETGGGIFFPSTAEMEKQRTSKNILSQIWLFVKGVICILTPPEIFNVSTWASWSARARQGDTLVHGRMWGSLRTSLPLYLCHNRFGGHWRLWFPYWASIIVDWSRMLHAIPPRSSSHLWWTLIGRLRLWLWLGLLRYASVRCGAAFHGGRAILEGHWLGGVGLVGPCWLSVSCSKVSKAVGLLVAAFGPSFDSR